MAKSSIPLTQERLKQVLDYNPETGLFTWLITQGKAIAGEIAGCKSKTRYYVVIGIDKKTYFAHRLACLYMTGKWPAHELDHEDLCRSNNIWTNLREATHCQNLHNVARRANNTSGFKGVHWHKDKKKWRAEITINMKSIHLGYHKSAREAHAAYCKAAIEHHKEFARLN